MQAPGPKVPCSGGGRRVKVACPLAAQKYGINLNKGKFPNSE